MKQQLICEVLYTEFTITEWVETIYLFDGWVVKPGENVKYISGNECAIIKPSKENIKNIRYE